MTWRAIQDTVPQSESLAAVSSGAERLYWRMLATTDSWGRLAGSVRKVRAVCIPLIPARDEEIEWWMRELEEAGRIFRYGANGSTAIQVIDFETNQPKELFRRRGESRFPEPPKRRDLQATPGVSRPTPEQARLDVEEKREEEPPMREHKPLSHPPREEPVEETQRPRDVIWDALVVELGEPQTRSERGRRNAAVKELRDAGATAGEVRLRCKNYRKMWPGITLTATALSANWTLLDPRGGRPASPPCGECGVGGGMHAEDCSVAHG